MSIEEIECVIKDLFPGQRAWITNARTKAWSVEINFGDGGIVAFTVPIGAGFKITRGRVPVAIEIQEIGSPLLSVVRTDDDNGPPAAA